LPKEFCNTEVVAAAAATDFCLPLYLQTGKCYELLDYVKEKFEIRKPIVGDFNYSNIVWYPVHGSGASARCSSLNNNEMAFVSSLRENLLMQHVTNPTRQRGGYTQHTLDLVITSEEF